MSHKTVEMIASAAYRINNNIIVWLNFDKYGAFLYNF